MHTKGAFWVHAMIRVPQAQFIYSFNPQKSPKNSKKPTFLWVFLVGFRYSYAVHSILLQKKDSPLGCLFAGSPTKNSLYNPDNFKRFAYFDGKTYVPRKYHRNQVLSRKERLWLFMTARTAIEKRLMCHLEYVKHSSK